MVQVNAWKQSLWVAIGWFIGSFAYKLLLHPEESLARRFVDSIGPALLLFVLSVVVYVMLSRRK
ncbi:MAG TPA: hypothetical protein VGE59_00680 [Patescibacteria group bacterium]